MWVMVIWRVDGGDAGDAGDDGDGGVGGGSLPCH